MIQWYNIIVVWWIILNVFSKSNFLPLQALAMPVWSLFSGWTSTTLSSWDGPCTTCLRRLHQCCRGHTATMTGIRSGVSTPKAVAVQLTWWTDWDSTHRISQWQRQMPLTPQTRCQQARNSGSKCYIPNTNTVHFCTNAIAGYFNCKNVHIKCFWNVLWNFCLCLVNHMDLVWCITSAE